MPDESGSWLPYVGVGGAAVCCLALEILGGAALLGGLTAATGLSTGVTYLVLVGIGGILAAILARFVMRSSLMPPNMTNPRIADDEQ